MEGLLSLVCSCWVYTLLLCVLMWDAHAATLCVQRSVDLLLFTCLEDDWDKLMKLVEFYARDKSYLSQVSGPL